MVKFKVLFRLLSTGVLFSIPAFSVTAGPICANDIGTISNCAAPGTIPFRTIDGTGNNLENPLWGSVGQAFNSAADMTGYKNTNGDPVRMDMPSVREVSNELMGTDTPVTSKQNLSNLFWSWGQFVDHDITLTPEGEGENATQDMRIEMGNTDPNFTEDLNFERSEQNTSNQQINTQTAYIDASMVYGTTDEMAANLRENNGTGRLRTSDANLLPTDTDGNFIAGDPRVNEQQQLIAMQTVLMREHNRIADAIYADDPTLSDEQIYQSARAVVGAQVQSITYNEWLPALLGDNSIGAYKGYDPSVDATLSNEFSACAFRFCHSMIPEEVDRLEENGHPSMDGKLKLADSFFAPDMFRNTDMDDLLRGLADNVAMESDISFSDSIRNFLDPAGNGELSDLASLNLQRGRDHGLPDYNTLREAYGLDTITSWAELTDDPILQARLQDLYGSLDHIDPYVGAMIEEAINGGLVGELNAGIIVDQFTRLRDGDRFWYENYFTQSMVDTLFSQNLIDSLFDGNIWSWLGNRTLSSLLLNNTEISWLQSDSFYAQSRLNAVNAPQYIGIASMIILLGIAGIRRQRRKTGKI